MYIKAKVLAGAKKETFEQTDTDSFRIAVKEPAERNCANKRVQELLGLHFKIPVKAVRMIGGHRAPAKLFLLPDS
jgi:uncharacterized protein YggU (UPF0235/DUF167 family)